MFYLEDKKFLSKKQKDFINGIVLGEDFPFYIIKNAAYNDGCDFLSHIVKRRHEDIKEGESEYNSSWHPQVCDILYSFLNKNKIKFKKILRIAFNLTFNNGHIKCDLHEDHSYPHKQIIIYLNNPLDKESKTVILDKNKKVFKEIKPEQYKAVCFDSHLHYHFFPKKGKRVVLIATFN